MARKDLSAFGLAKGVVRKLSKAIGHADLTAAADNQDIACGAIPTGSLILGAEVKIVESFDNPDDVATYDLDAVTVGGTEIGLGRVGDDTSLDAVATFSDASFIEAGGAVLANIQVSAGNVSVADEGSLTLKIYYVESAVEQPS